LLPFNRNKKKEGKKKKVEKGYRNGYLISLTRNGRLRMGEV